MSSEASPAPSLSVARGDETPPRFGKYQLLRLLARGGMGEVYLARLVGELGFEKQLVVKTILPELAAKPRFIEMFAAEAKTAVALSHGNIVPTYELGRWGDTFYIVMGYVDGPSVSQLLSACRRRDLPPNLPAAMHVIRAVLSGLAYAHREEPGRPAVVHRDVSPRNILIDRSGQVRIVDFGIAARAREQVELRAGSQGYMAPEQARAEAADPRADVFSTACVLYELVTHQKAFPRDGVWIQPDFEAVPAELFEPLTAAMSLDPDARPRDATAFLQSLRPAMVDHALTFGDAELAGWLAEVFPDGWDHHSAPASAGKTSVREPDADIETFATRLTAVTNIHRETAQGVSDPEAADAESDASGPRAGSTSAATPTSLETDEVAARVEPSAPQRRRLPVWGWAAVAGLVGVLAMRMFESAPDPPTPTQRPARRVAEPVPAAAMQAQTGPASEARPPSLAPTESDPIASSSPSRGPQTSTVEPGSREPDAGSATVDESDEWIHRLRVDPPDAVVEVEGRPLAGSSPHRIELPETGDIELTIRKDGFATRTVRLSRHGDLPARLALSREQPKGEGHLKVLAPSVAWAEVRVDGRNLGATPTRKIPLPEGKHSLEVRCIPDVCPTERVLFKRSITITTGEIELITVP